MIALAYLIGALDVVMATPAPGPNAVDERPRIVLDASACASAGDEIGELLALELHAAVEEGASEDGHGAARAHVACHGDSARITLAERRTNATTAYDLDLSHTPVNARARILALSIADWFGARFAAPTAASPAPEPTPAVRSAPAAPVASRWWIEPLFAVLWTGDMGAEPGAGLRVRRGGARWGWQVDAIVSARDRSLPLANARVRVGTLGLAGWVQTPGELLRSRVGAGMRIGIARMDGQPRTAALTADAVTGPWGGPFALAAVGIGRRRSVERGAELGYAQASLTAREADRSQVRRSGLWAGLSLGVGF